MKMVKTVKKSSSCEREEVDEQFGKNTLTKTVPIAYR